MCSSYRLIHPFGVGPPIGGPALLLLAAAWFAGRWVPVVSTGFPTEVARWVGLVLLGAGVVVYAAGLRQFRTALRGELVTTGLFGWCRHPFYAIWIFLLLPGLACLVGNWVGVTAPFLAAVLFRLLIRREEEELEARFGEAYRDYTSRVGRLWSSSCLALRGTCRTIDTGTRHGKAGRQDIR